MLVLRQVSLAAGLLILTISALMGSQSARAACIDAPDTGVRRLRASTAADPNQALAQADEALRNAPVTRATTARIGWLHAVRAEAFTVLERDMEARAAAAEGLRLAPEGDRALRLALLSLDAENVYDAAGLAAAIHQVELARAENLANADIGTCLLITLGTLQYRNDNSDLAITTLMQAYRAASAAEKLQQRVLAADALSSVMREIGDYRQALELNAEVVEWNKAHQYTLALSVSQYLRANILQDMRHFEAAVHAYEEARSLSIRVRDTLGVAFSDMRLCEVQTELGKSAMARPSCDSALDAFSKAGAEDMVAQTRALLAKIDLQQGNPARALATLDDILSAGADGVPPRSVASVFKVRAQANAARGNFAKAYSDLDEYTKRYVSAAETRRAREISGLRARFETDREIERNADLQRELAVSQRRRTELQRFTWVVVGAGMVVVALLTAMLLGARRHRRQLSQLANIDALTELPNRRHTAELAARAITAAIEMQRPLTIALIDLDHFKFINDEFGHAAGDQVLREFARSSREAVRGSDTIGRWGGEEFLLVMPDTTPDWALAIVDRLRARASEIVLPPNKPGFQVSLSAGLACTGANTASLEELIALADAALYAAKDEGRNRVRVDGRSIENASSGVRRALVRAGAGKAG